MTRMLEVVLVEPQIATNTGNIIRLCANVGAALHLVRPLGFDVDSAALRRGGLDYHELTDTRIWDAWEDCRAALGAERRWFATTTHAPHHRYDRVVYEAGDVVVFGCEATGLGEKLLRILGVGELDQIERAGEPVDNHRLGRPDQQDIALFSSHRFFP
jgi:tRNA (cytidine/uridine-2'-O-)-methyltransferase